MAPERALPRVLRGVALQVPVPEEGQEEARWPQAAACALQGPRWPVAAAASRAQPVALDT